MGICAKVFGVRDDQGRPVETGQLKELYKKSISIAWPSTVEGALLSIIGSVDTMMVGTLGSAAIAAARSDSLMRSLRVPLKTPPFFAAAMAKRIGPRSGQSPI